MVHPDNPSLVSVDFLKKLDADPPGTWLAQPKLDGWRRVLVKGPYANGTYPWTAHAKRGSEGAVKPFPPDLAAELERLPVPDGTAFDAEWVGPHVAEHFKSFGFSGPRHSLHIFDCLMWEGKWLRTTPFKHRVGLLRIYGPPERNIFTVQKVPNPGLVDLFQQQLTNPLSEGLVIRRADSGLILSETKCADNPLWFKIRYRNIREVVK